MEALIFFYTAIAVGAAAMFFYVKYNNKKKSVN